ncbi:hypothetical protein AWC38_SpisGene17475 [Stylophora pistillata]|uniref:Uncharacterized protein n=1 Tax=Stylophora pistillata TaxID=50429 RepID=A0A2B4RMZ2_STYPI|nr:hypothetical protein AWC38_SpisGene17475 [Stylophora pistillata]
MRIFVKLRTPGLFFFYFLYPFTVCPVKRHVCLRSRMKWRPMRNLSFILLRGKQLLLVIFRPNSSLVEKLYVSFSLGRISAVVEQDKRPMEARSTRTVTLVGTFFWKDILKLPT